MTGRWKQRIRSLVAGTKQRTGRWYARLNSSDTTRLDRAVAWLHRSKPGRWLVNGAAELTLLSVKLARATKRRLRDRTVSPSSAAEQPALRPGYVQEQPRVLLLVEPTIPQCFHYRVQQKLDQFAALGWYAEWLSWADTEAAVQRMHFVDCVIFYRAPGFPKVLNAIDRAKRLGKLVCYDVDDLIFDRDQLHQKFSQNSAQLSDQDLQDILNGAELYRSAMAACSYGIASTPALQQQMAPLLAQQHCFLLPNGLDKQITAVADLPAATKESDRITIFYGSGTKTHDEDFAILTQPLAQLMARYTQVHVVIVGHLTVPAELQPFAERLQRLPLMDFASYLYCLRQADIALAPLQPGLFADCKSEIKWLEAAAMGVPSMVSATECYRRVVQDAVTGLVAETAEQWFSALQQLVTDADARQRIGATARNHVLQHYGPTAMAQSMQRLLSEVQQQAVDDGVQLPASPRQHLLLVNVLYPPQALGGATTVMVNQIQQLRRDYADQFDVSVLTCEMDDEQPYTVREYHHDGVNVTVVKLPFRDNLETNAHDDRLLALYQQWLPQCRPDIVHCHSMQRLTASLLQAARQLSIPYLVTLHDAWWLSEHQFLLDADQQQVQPRQLNPLIAARTASNPATAIARARYLAKQLQHADCLLAVSDYQAQLYRENGFTDVVVHRNAVARPAQTETLRPDSEDNKLTIGYLGGKSAHKGYDFLQTIVRQHAYPNLRFVLVDVFQPQSFTAQQQWGQSEVQLRGKVDAQSIARFYQSIDVLIAPSIWPESFGLVTREAALHGVWVVAAEAGGLAEDVIDGDNGFVFPLRDAAACADILQRLNDDFVRYQHTRPDSDVADRRIATLEQHTQALVRYYQHSLA